MNSQKPVHGPENSDCLGWDSDRIEDHDQGDESSTWYGSGADARHGRGDTSIVKRKELLKMVVNKSRSINSWKLLKQISD